MKRVVFLILCFLLISSSVFAVVFSDVPDNHWASTCINKLANDGVILGYGDGAYHPDEQISYGQFIKLVMATKFSSEMFENEGVTGDYNHWAAPYVKLAEIYGIIEAGDITQENIDSPIPRIEMVSIISMADMILNSKEFDCSKKLEFSDIFSVVGKERTLLQHAYSRGLVLGDAEGTFRPNDYMIRSEAAMMIYRFCGLGGE